MRAHFAGYAGGATPGTGRGHSIRAGSVNS
jgi:hypothetical protein